MIICTSNRAKYLNYGIDSIITQTFEDWEIIFVNDSSTDNTFEVVNQYIQNFHNIRYFFFVNYWR
ncbi:glycosyltransferase family 2 protein [Fortiea sp. LEGE XX443]|uniref:glycosyltransferase family 2 protein n=1 Tax=Fortiea sp. LEGE XX443 TaxID=1828611 RepID=UPI001D13F61C|nr:glycosyltransferase [Fortiea sp. LEGE XX443]